MSAVPADLWATLDRELPIALLPVRVEIRSDSRIVVVSADEELTETAEMPMLRVRIYPDELSIVTRPIELSGPEAAAGLRFWQRHEHAADPEEVSGGELLELPDEASVRRRRRSAWELLTREVGTERAVHVAHATRGGVPPPSGPTSREPAVARLLPDAWVVLGHADGEVVVSALVPVPADTIQMGPSSDPDHLSFDPADPLVIADPGLRWITDFAEAERRGMAVTIDLLTPEQALQPPPGWLESGLDSLVVIGVRAGAAADPTGEARRLADLVHADAAADRVAFVPTGIPTNNLAGQPSGWTRADDPFALFDRLMKPAGAPGAGVGPAALEGTAGTTAAHAFSSALGIDHGAVAALDGADDTGLAHARDMAAALFPVSFAEGMRTLLVPEGFEGDPDAVTRLDVAREFARDHVARFVRGRGPLPTVRIGRQPYGCLPATALSRFTRVDADPPTIDGLIGLLRGFRPFWVQAAARLPMLSGEIGEMEVAASRLLRILQQAPFPHESAYLLRMAARAGVGDGSTSVNLSWVNTVFAQFLRKDADFAALVAAAAVPDAGAPASGLGQAILDGMADDASRVALRDALVGSARDQGVKAVIGAVVDSALGARGDPTRLSALDRISLTSSARVTAPAASATDQHTPAGYLARLAGLTVPSSEGDGEPRDLLYHLISQSLLLNSEPGDFQWMKDRKAIHDERFEEYRTKIEEYNDLVAQAAEGLPVVGPVAPLDLILDDTGQFRFWYELPDGVRLVDDGSAPHSPVAAVTRLAAAALDDREYARLLGESLACASTRFDAWVTSLASRRLATLRQSRPTGLHVGCWGALVGVRWRRPVTQAPPRGWSIPGGPDRVRVPARQVGYVHAPSLAHARTAGVLRAAELGHHGDGSTLATLDLTSRTARIARDVLDAVHNGLSLPAVLGSHLERRLGDAGLQGCIASLRGAFPQHRVKGAAGEPSAGSDRVAPTNVVDGLDVWRAGATVAALCPDGGDRLEAVLADLDLVVQSVADALVAQGVHHLVAGRAQQAGSTFRALADAGPPPLEFDVLTTPRSGIPITHRLVLALGPLAGSPPAATWNHEARRAKLAPALEAWVEGLLGSADACQVRVRGSSSSGGEVDTIVRIDATRRCALDVVVELFDSPAPKRSTFAQRLAVAAGLVDVTELVDTGDGAWTRLSALAGAIAAVLGAACPARPEDLEAPPAVATASLGGVAPEPTALPTASILAMADVVASALQAIDAAAQALVAAAEHPPETGILADSLLAPLADLGIAGTILPSGALTPPKARGAIAAAQGLVRDVAQLVERAVSAVADGSADAAPSAAPTSTGTWQERLPRADLGRR